MPVSTRRTAPPSGSTQWASYGEHDDEASSSDSDDEGIPAETPKRSKLQAMPTLSTRQSPLKRRLEVEPGQLTQSPKKPKSSEHRNITEEQRQPRSMNEYPTPNSSRIAPEPAADVESLDAISVRTSVEEEDDGYVNPHLLAAVNRSCGTRKPKESPDMLLEDEADNVSDGDDEISVIALDDYEETDPGQAIQYSEEAEDLDLGAEPTNQGTQKRDITISQTKIPLTGGESDVQRANEDIKPAEAVAESGDEHSIGRNRKPTQIPKINAPEMNDYEIPESPEHATSSFPSTGPTIHASSIPERRKNGPRRPKTKPMLPELISQDEDHAAIAVTLRPLVPAIPNLSMERRGVDGPSPLSLRGPVEPLGEEAAEEIAFDGTLASGNSGSASGANGAEHEIQQGGENGGDDDDDYIEDEEYEEEPGSTSDDDDVGGALETEAQFSRDINHFKNQIQEAGHDSALFDVAIDNPLLSIHLPSQSLSGAIQLMKRLGWTAITKQWQDNLTDKRRARTSPGKHLVRYLLKLERFFLMTPHVDMLAQKDFLIMHADMLRSYFSTIESDVERIRGSRLSSKSNATADNQSPARCRMVEDLVRLIIPLMVRVLGEAWALGGDEADSAFTGLSVQILSRLTVWLKTLYDPLLREPIICFPKGGSGTTNIKAREALGPHLEILQNLLDETPDRLREKEESRLRFESNRKIKLRRQEELKTRRHVEAKLREIAYIEQNRRVAQAIRGARPSPRQTLDLAHWRMEEELSLCNRLKGAYDYNPPQLPQLATVALELGHSEQETKNKSRDLLMVMLAQAYPQKTGRDIQDMANELMRQWG